MLVGNAPIVAEAVLAAEAAAVAADSASQAGATRQPKPDRTGSFRCSVVAHDCQRGRADTGGYMHRPRIHTHYSLGLRQAPAS